jgi:hypothetical protein
VSFEYTRGFGVFKEARSLLDVEIWGHSEQDDRHCTESLEKFKKRTTILHLKLQCMIELSQAHTELPSLIEPGTDRLQSPWKLCKYSHQSYDGQRCITKMYHSRDMR